MIEKAIGPANWRRCDLQNSETWVYILNDAEKTEVRNTLASVIERNVAFKDMTLDDFKLPVLAPVLSNLQDELENGLGLKLLRGFPTKGLNTDHLRAMY